MHRIEHQEYPRARFVCYKASTDAPVRLTRTLYLNSSTLSIILNNFQRPIESCSFINRVCDHSYFQGCGNCGILCITVIPCITILRNQRDRFCDGQLLNGTYNYDCVKYNVSV